MKKIPFALLILLLLKSALFANDDINPKELFDEADCMSCHNNEDFVPKKSKVNNFAKLHKTVKACEFGNDTGWFDDETLEVSKYLNKKHYKFKETKVH